MKERTLKRLIGIVGLGRLAGLGAGAVVVGDAIGGLHPEAVEDVVDDRDLVEVLDPIGAVIARHDEAQRKAVEERQILAVHGIGQHHLAVARVVDVERLDEIRSLVGHGPVHAVEGDLLGAGLHAGLVEHGLERHALPARIAHGAVAELAAGDARLEEAAAVARALVDRHDFDRPKRVLSSAKDSLSGLSTLPLISR